MAISTFSLVVQFYIICFPLKMFIYLPTTGWSGKNGTKFTAQVVHNLRHRVIATIAIVRQAVQKLIEWPTFAPFSGSPYIRLQLEIEIVYQFEIRL